MSQIAAQMFTTREFTKTAKDLAETLKKLQEMGYTAVQLSAVKAMGGDSPEVDAAQAKRMLDDHGMRCIATHRKLEDLLEKIDEEIEFHKTLDCDFCAIGSMPKPYREGGCDSARRLIADLAPIGANLKEAGIRFGYHNHAFEFKRDATGKRPFDVLVEEGGPDLMMEIDTYWVAHPGANPARQLERCAGRIPVIHVKDKVVTEGNDTFMAPVGEGNLEWDEILEVCKAGGCEWYAVEQDHTYNERDPFDCLKSSYDFLSARGL